MGYHLGRVYVIKMEENRSKLSPNLPEMRIHRKFDAHSRPITGMIVNEDIGKRHNNQPSTHPQRYDLNNLLLFYHISYFYIL